MFISIVYLNMLFNYNFYFRSFKIDNSPANLCMSKHIYFIILLYVIYIYISHKALD